ncbi:MAG TPA: hypothetical protein VLH08_00830 [Acidobacteriota bacterium]|nr:hypothetical protein [Acidobacteriota bacterium]
MRYTTLMIVLTTIVLMGANYALATDGGLDSSFGTNGLVTLDIYDADNFNDVAVFSDGSMIAVGSAYTGQDFDVVIVKYDADGNLMNEFDDDGIVIADFGNGDSDGANAIYLLPNKEFLIAGYAMKPGTYHDFLLAKYHADGSIDSNFGVGGKVIQALSAGTDFAIAVGIQNGTGRIIVAGTANTSIGLAAYTSNGQLDSTFGNNGIMNEDLDPHLEHARGMAFDGNRILIGGSVDNQFMVARYTANGFPDSNFGTGGLITLDLTAGNDEVEAIAVQSDGRIVLGGYVVSGPTDGSYDVALARFNSNGTPDSDFGNNGVVFLDLGGQLFGGNEELRDLAIQNDQKIIATGATDVVNDNLNFMIARFMPNGDLDPTFGSNGLVYTDIVSNADRVFGAHLSGGSLVVVGRTENGVLGDLALARYITQPSIPAPSTCSGALFCDLFDDVFSGNWTYVKPSWTDTTGGALIGTPAGKKAIAIAPDSWANTYLYTIQTSMKSSGGDRNSVWLLGWYADKRNTVELQMKEGNDKWILKHRVNGVIVAKAKGMKQIDANTEYIVKVIFDGSQFKVFVDNPTMPLITLPTSHAVAAGTVGFAAKNTTVTVDAIRVDLNLGL